MFDLNSIAVIDLTDRRQEAYNADMTWVLASMFAAFGGNKNFDVAAPSRNLQDSIERMTAHNDSRSGKQIIKSVFEKMKSISERGG